MLLSGLQMVELWDLKAPGSVGFCLVLWKEEVGQEVTRGSSLVCWSTGTYLVTTMSGHWAWHFLPWMSTFQAGGVGTYGGAITGSHLTQVTYQRPKATGQLTEQRMLSLRATTWLVFQAPFGESGNLSHW